MALDGVRGDVTQVKVAGLLQQRKPRILTDDDPDQVARFEERVKGASVAVVLLVGASDARVDGKSQQMSPELRAEKAIKPKLSAAKRQPQVRRRMAWARRCP